MVSGLTVGGELRFARGRTFAVALVCLSLSACAVHWPWKHHPKPPPPAVHYIDVKTDAGTGISQYWDRNTLKLDLTAQSGEGQATLTPVDTVGWPVRLEFLVRPGSFSRLEVLAAQRVVFDVPAKGRLLVLKLDPGAYEAKTTSITLRWSVVDDSEH